MLWCPILGNGDSSTGIYHSETSGSVAPRLTVLMILQSSLMTSISWTKSKTEDGVKRPPIKSEQFSSWTLNCLQPHPCLHARNNTKMRRSSVLELLRSSPGIFEITKRSKYAKVLRMSPAQMVAYGQQQRLAKTGGEEREVWSVGRLIYK